MQPVARTQPTTPTTARSARDHIEHQLERMKVIETTTPSTVDPHDSVPDQNQAGRSVSEPRPLKMRFTHTSGLSAEHQLMLSQGVEIRRPRSATVNGVMWPSPRQTSGGKEHFAGEAERGRSRLARSISVGGQLKPIVDGTERGDGIENHQVVRKDMGLRDLVRERSRGRAGRSKTGKGKRGRQV
jgi:hypothetical protein